MKLYADLPGRRTVQILADVGILAWVSLWAWVGRLVHDTTMRAFAGVPQVQDEIGYDLLARHLANGDPIPASHPLSDPAVGRRKPIA